MTKLEFKQKFPLCFSIAFCNSYFFKSRKWRVEEDKNFLVKLYLENNQVALDSLEAFYKQLNNSSQERKCIMNKHRRSNEQF